LPDGRYVREESRRNVIFGLSKAKELLGRAIPFFLIGEPMALAVDALTSHQSSLAARAAINPEVAMQYSMWHSADCSPGERGA
jgi:hypothetical protein